MMLSTTILPYLPTDHLFDALMRLEGEVFRSMQGRTTLRVQLGEKHYFIKRHTGVGWVEILKNLILLRLPIVSAKNEWQALTRLAQLGIETPTLVGYGCRGINPAKLQSFVMTKELETCIPLDKLGNTWPTSPPPVPVKRRIIAKVAHIAHTLHAAGINHRDFYLCHFWLATLHEFEPKIFLMDLHRAQIRKKIPKRWQLKDLAALYFSSLQVGLTRRDLLRFVRIYCNKPLRDSLKNSDFWQKLIQQTRALYQKALAKNLYGTDESRVLTAL